MTELLYADIHRACYHYEKQESPTIRTIVLDRDVELQINFNTIVIVLDGNGSISYRKVIRKPIKKDDMLLFPVHTQVKIKIEDTLSFLIFKLNPSFHFCDHFTLEALYKGMTKRRKEFSILKVDERLGAYVKSLLLYLKDGLKCRYFLELKLKELFYVLRAYNKEQDLAAFFTPMLSEDMELHSFVMDNYLSTRTIKDLAQKANYSITGFEKRFKRVFGATAHDWMKEQLASNVYHEIHCTRKTFVEISDTYGFSSSAHLTNFCKTMFGLSPTAMRKGEDEENSEDCMIVDIPKEEKKIDS